MKPYGIHFGVGVVVLAALSILMSVWLHGAAKRLDEAKAVKDGEVAVASASDVQYCSPALKAILRRVLTSCGLVKGGGSRGCQPVEAKNVAAMSGGDFNALFAPMAERAAIIEFDVDKGEIDDAARLLVDKTFSDQKGASYFLVVSRASPEGSVEHNRKLSEARAGAVLDHLKTTFNDPDLEQEVGLLWLGEEFAQLDQQFCQWKRSHMEKPCDPNQLNRSAFVAWIDCRL
jgi:outer membrane protein OmpA-like peptidoglycan-associated protein